MNEEMILTCVAIKNYLFENNLLKSFDVSKELMWIQDLELTELHYTFHLNNNSELHVFRSVDDGKLYVNNNIVRSWKDLKEMLKQV